MVLRGVRLHGSLGHLMQELIVLRESNDGHLNDGILSMTVLPKF